MLNSINPSNILLQYQTFLPYYYSIVSSCNTTVTTILSRPNTRVQYSTLMSYYCNCRTTAISNPPVTLLYKSGAEISFSLVKHFFNCNSFLRYHIVDQSYNLEALKAKMSVNTSNGLMLNITTQGKMVMKC